MFRLDVGLSTDGYESLFGPPSPDHLAGGGRDFCALDVLLPHPVYARQHWVSILNPSAVTFRPVVWPLLEGAYQKAAQKCRRSRSH